MPPLYLLTPASLSKSFYYSDHITGTFASLEWTCNYPNNVLLVQSSVSVVECGLTGSGQRKEAPQSSIKCSYFHNKTHFPKEWLFLGPYTE